MKPTRLQGASIIGLVAIACFAGGQYFSFQSFCAGDLKGGTGDIGRALELENVSVGFIFAGLALLLPAFGMILRHHDRTRFEAVILSAVIVFVAAVVVVLTTLQLSVELLRFCPGSDLA